MTDLPEHHAAERLSAEHLLAEHLVAEHLVAEHLVALKKWFADRPGVLVAFSAGVDSSVVAFLAKHYLGASRMLAVMTASPSLKRSDLDEGQRFCHTHQIPLRIIHTQELANENYAANPNNRCYFCKTTLYADMTGLLDEFPGYVLANGQNLDDAGDYRPGIRAADEHAVLRPLVDCRIDKQAVRGIAQHFDLACWDKPASPCLSSRIPYGQAVTLKKLQRIEAAEDHLQALGFPVCRVRHDETTARIEVPADEVAKLSAMQPTLEPHFRSLGFDAVAIDAEGFVSGKLNRAVVHLTVKNHHTP